MAFWTALKLRHAVLRAPRLHRAACAVLCQQSCLLPHLLSRVPGGARGTLQQWQACLLAAELAASGGGGKCTVGDAETDVC